MNFDTLCIHGSEVKYDRTGAVSVPIFQSSTLCTGGGAEHRLRLFKSAKPHAGAPERTLTRLENGVDALAFSSGMAALTALMELFSPGDHIIASDDLYGGSGGCLTTSPGKTGWSLTCK